MSFGVSSKTDWVISLISILLIPTNRTNLEFKAAAHELTKAYFEGIVAPYIHLFLSSDHKSEFLEFFKVCPLAKQKKILFPTL